MTQQFDLLIKNGHLIDGTGNPYYKADIGITNGQINCIRKDIAPKGAQRVIRADRLIVSPGFLDTHSHDDLYLLINPSCDEKILQGVTTTVMGNCGFSPAPISEDYRADIEDALRVMGGQHIPKEDLDIQSFDDFLRKLELIKPGINVLGIAICAVLCGARSYAAIAEWAKRCSQKMLNRLWCRFDENTQRYVPPSEPTIRRLLQSIDAEAVDQHLGGWLRGLFTTDAIGFDGKLLKGARREDRSRVHLLSAFVHQEGITVAQRQIESKSNEIPGARPLLEPLGLKGKVVTADAMHTQRQLARFLVKDKQADYCFTVKDNQSTLKEDIAELALSESFPPSLRDH